MAEEQVQNPINSLLAEFGPRLNEVEEKQRLVKCEVERFMREAERLRLEEKKRRDGETRDKR